jgi:putative membrane protein
MPRLFATSSVMAGLVTIGAAVGGAQTGTGASAGQATPQREAGTARGDTRDFINRMTIAGLTEVQLGNLAIERASSPDVKAFGQMMVKDHSHANTELHALATRMNVQPPTELDKKHRDLVEHLSNVLPAEFDREYAKAMIEGHKEVLDQLRKRIGDQVTPAGSSGVDRPRPTTAPEEPQAVGTSGAADDDPLTRWARTIIPTVAHHLERAQQLHQNIK